MCSSKVGLDEGGAREVREPDSFGDSLRILRQRRWGEARYQEQTWEDASIREWEVVLGWVGTGWASIYARKNGINAIGTGNRNDRNRRGCLSPHMEIFCWEKPEVCYKRGVFLLPFNLSRFEGLLVLTWGRFTWKTFTTSLSAHTLFCRKNRDFDHSTRIYTS